MISFAPLGWFLEDSVEEIGVGGVWNEKEFHEEERFSLDEPIM